MPIKTLKYLNILISAAVLLGCSARPARAQYTGTVTPQTVAATLATNLACTGSPQLFVTSSSTLNAAGFRNIGQTQHYISAIFTGIITFKAEIDGIDSAGNVFRLSDVLVSSLGGIPLSLSGTGAYPNIQISVTCTPGSGNFTLSYSGTSATSSPSVGSYLLAQIDKTIAAAAPANAGLQSTFQTPFGNSAGTIEFTFSVAGPAGSLITVGCLSDVLGGTLQQFTLVTTTPIQFFPVNPGACPIAVVNYISGGASAATFGMEYVFSPNGAPAANSSAANLAAAINTVPTIIEKGARWGTQTSAPAAGSQATTSKAAGVAGVRHVADCVTWSAGAAAAPAATLLTINLRDGATGAGTIIWQTTINAAATAAQHGSGTLCGLNLIGTAATAMTLEFSAALANESESVALTGYDVQ